MRVTPTIRRCAVSAGIALAVSGAMAQTAPPPVPPTAQSVAASEQKAGVKALHMPTEGIPVAYAGQLYRASIRMEGGVGPYQVLTDGELPQGITYEAGSNVIVASGVPVAVGTYDSRVTVVDSLGAMTTHAYSFDVQPRPMSNGCNCVTITDAEAMHITDATVVFFAAVIGIPEAFHITDGLTDFGSKILLDSEAFHIGDSIGILLASDQVVPEAFHINDATTVVTEVGVSPAVAPGGTYNAAYSQAFTAVGNTGAVTVTPSGTLPVGLSFTTSGGTTTLHGTPTQAGTFSFSISAHDTVRTNVVAYSLVINTAAQTIAIGTLPTATYGTPFALTATASPSGLPVTIASTSALATGTNPFTGVATGSASFQATQAGSATYSTATPVNFNVNIGPATLLAQAANQTRVFDQPNPTLTYGLSGFVNGDTAGVVSGTPLLSVTATPVSSASSTYPITLATGTLSATNYTFTPGTGTLTITKAPQSITFYPLPVLSNGSSFTLSARARSGLPVTYSVSGPATITNSVLTVTGSGTVTVIANQAGNANYSAATAVSRSFVAP